MAKRPGVLRVAYSGPMTILFAILVVQVVCLLLALGFGRMSGRAVGVTVYIAGVLLLTPPVVLLALTESPGDGANVSRGLGPGVGSATRVDLGERLVEQYGQGPYRYMGPVPESVVEALGRDVERLVPADAEDFAASPGRPVLVLYDGSGSLSEVEAAKPPPDWRLDWTWRPRNNPGYYYFYVPARVPAGAGTSGE